MQIHHVTGFHFERSHAEYVAVLITDQVQRHPFDKELGVRTHVALIQGVQQRVTGTVCCRASAWYGFFTIVRGVTAKRTLINRAIWVTVKWHTEMFELVHVVGRLTAHKFNRVLIAQPVRTFDRVVKVVVPVVFGHIAQRCTDTALSRDGV